MRTIVYASFTSSEDAERAIGALLDHGVATQDLSVALNEKHRPYTSDDDRTAKDVIGHADKGITVTTPDDMGSGAAKGAGVGLGIGALAAIASIVVPGFGLILGGGALAAAIGGMVGATAAGAIAGGAVGYLKDQGLPDDTAERYAMAIGEGGAVVSVSVPSNGVAGHTVEEVLRKYGGIDVHHLEPAPATAVIAPLEDAETVGRRSF